MGIMGILTIRQFLLSELNVGNKNFGRESASCGNGHVKRMHGVPE